MHEKETGEVWEYFELLQYLGFQKKQQFTSELSRIIRSACERRLLMFLLFLSVGVYVRSPSGI